MQVILQGKVKVILPMKIVLFHHQIILAHTMQVLQISDLCFTVPKWKAYPLRTMKEFQFFKKVCVGFKKKAIICTDNSVCQEGKDIIVNFNQEEIVI